MEKLTGHRSWRPCSECGAPLKSPCGKSGAVLATVPALPWLCGSSQGQSCGHTGCPGLPWHPKHLIRTKLHSGAGSSPQAEQMRGLSCPSRLQHKSIEGKVSVLLFFCLFDCTKSNKNIPHSAKCSAREAREKAHTQGHTMTHSSPSCVYRSVFVSLLCTAMYRQMHWQVAIQG